VQLIALGEVRDLAQAREVIRAGADAEIDTTQPSGDDRVARRYDRYRELVAEDQAAAGS
jgi:hypothetical protein